MADAQRVSGVLIPDELTPALARVLWAGIDALAIKQYRPSREVRDVIELITQVARERSITSGVGSDRRKWSEMGPGLESQNSGGVLGTAAVADLLHVSQRRVTQLADGGQLRGLRIGRTWTFEREAVDDYQHRNAS